ncbi:MAG: hypothetical protein ACJ77N_05020, partial [Chloroflexota bacterium]
MPLDERFDDLIDSLGGFHRTWLVYLGIELGLFGALRSAGPAGVSIEDVATETGTRPDAVRAWAVGADAQDLVTLEGDRLVADEDVASILVDDDRPEYLGG